jgi:hypothetical protein
MIRLYIFFLTSTLLVACTSNYKKQKERFSSNFKTLDTVVPFSGFWVNETYVKNIERTKSPRQSQNVMESCLTIPARTLQPTTMVSGFHDGAAEMVVVKKDNKFQFYYKDGDTISNIAYDIQSISTEKLKIGKIALSKPMKNS